MQIYPIPGRAQTLYEKLTLRLGFNVGYCPVCSSYSVFKHWTEQFRDTGSCVKCKARNRQRQIALLADRLCSRFYPRRYRTLRDTKLDIYNLESNGSLHNVLSRNPRYVSSEYLGSDREPGEMVQGVRHEDAQRLSFPDGKFDLVLSSDVWEHIPDPYAAHREIYRVLKRGGRHIFTVPFYQMHFLDENRARLDAAGNIEHILEPVYHLDPLNPEGVLVFNIFSIEMLCHLSRIGFYTRLYKLYSPFHGILGYNCVIFDALKANPKVK